MQTKKTQYHQAPLLPVIICIFLSAITTTGCISTAIQPSDIDILKNDVNDYKTRVTRLNDEMEEMKLIIETHEQTIKDLEKRNLTELPEKYSPRPVTKSPKALPPVKRKIVKVMGPKALYDQAYHTFSQRRLAQAQEQFENFLVKYPDSDLSDNAMYWLGEIKYFKKDFKSAISFFRELNERYPEGNKCPDALLKIGYSYLNLKDREKARLSLTHVLKKYPFSSAGAKAEMLLDRLN